MVEDDVHYLVQDRLEILDLDQRLGDLGEDHEDAAAFPFLNCGLHDRRFALESEVLVELGQRPEVGRRVDSRTLNDGIPNLQGEVPDRQNIPEADVGLGDEGVVDLDTVGAVEIPDREDAVVLDDFGVVTGNGKVPEDDVVIARSSQLELSPKGHPPGGITIVEY